MLTTRLLDLELMDTYHLVSLLVLGSSTPFFTTWLLHPASKL